MASPIIIKAKVSGSAKAKPAPAPSSVISNGSGGSQVAPRVLIRSPVMASSTPTTPTSSVNNSPLRVTAKVTRSARTPTTLGPSGHLPNGLSSSPRARTASTSTSMSSAVAARAAIGADIPRSATVAPGAPGPHLSSLNRARTGSMYSLNSAVAQSRNQSPVRRAPSPHRPVPATISTPRMRPNALATLAPIAHSHSPPGSVLSGQSASTSSLSSPVSPRIAPSSPRAGFHPRTPLDRAPSTNNGVFPKLRAKITPTTARTTRLEPPLPSPTGSVSPVSSRTHSPAGSRTHSRSGSESSSVDLATEAKVNRKIADLEIRNASLLQYNTTLEATKDRQTNELAALRRKMREMRLALPPPIFKAMKEQEKEQEQAAPVEEEEEEEAEEEPDPVFDRISATLLGLIERCREAVAAKDEKVRVLNVNQIKAWEGRRGDDGEERNGGPEADRNGDGDGEADSSFVTADGDENDESSDTGDDEDEREVAGLLDGPVDRTSLGRRVSMS